MIPKTVQRTIDEALADMEREIGEVLVRHATDAAIAGDVAAHADIGLKISWDQVNKAALELMREYRAGIARGGSTVAVLQDDGTTKREFVPWLKNQTDEVRTRIGELIQETIEQGGSLGAKEGSQGYQPGSLAEKLSEYFDQRKSHAATVARTEMSRIRNDAAFNRYVDAGIEEVDIIGGDDPCSDCQVLEGRYRIEDAPDLPAHPNCTHGAVPVVEVPA